MNKKAIAIYSKVSIPGAKIQITKAFFASSAKGKCQTKHCIVLLASVKHGKIAVGEKISFHNGISIIEDEISRIEILGAPVNIAYEGVEVGICLKYSRLRSILVKPSKIKEKHTKTSMMAVSGGLFSGTLEIASIIDAYFVPGAKNSCGGSGIVFGIIANGPISTGKKFIFKVNGNMVFEDTIRCIRDNEDNPIPSLNAGLGFIALEECMAEEFVAKPVIYA